MVKILKNSKIEKFIVFLIIFISAYNYVLPVDVFALNLNTSITFPFWAKKIEIIHGVFIHEALFLSYLVGLFLFSSPSKFLQDHNANNYATIIFGLCCLGIASTLINFQPIFDIFEACRIGILAMLFLSYVYWAKKFGATFLLRSFLLGIVFSTSINLYFSYIIMWNKVGIFPVLLGQNGPGGTLGFIIGIAAWLFLIRKTRVDGWIAIITTIIACFALMTSFSKLGLLMGFFGIIAWIAIIINEVFSRRKVQSSITIISIVVLFIFFLINSKKGLEIIESAKIVYYQKFGAEDEGIISINGSDEERVSYYYGVSEILFRNPMFGVGYSGFIGAILETNTFKRTGYFTEDLSPQSSNPHNAFLYYISANGIPGLLITILLFYRFSRMLLFGLKKYGKIGYVVWILISVATIIHANTLPTLFNTDIFYFSAAIACTQH